MVFLYLLDGSYVQVNGVTMRVAMEAQARGIPIGGIDPKQILWISDAHAFHAWCGVWEEDPEDVVII